MNRSTSITLVCALLQPVTVTAAGDGRSPVDQIKAWNEGISSSARYTKYCKMSTSAFVFYRGSNHLYWSDFAGHERLGTFGNDETRTWLQGDMHAENFGVFGNADGEVVYDVNDFDDSVIADYQYDLWRMATSLVLVARQNGLAADAESPVVDAFTRAYVAALGSYVGNDDESTTRFTADNTAGPLQEFMRQAESKRAGKSRKKMLDKWAPKTGGERRFDLTPTEELGVRGTEKLATLSSAERALIFGAVPAYSKTLPEGVTLPAGALAVKDVAVRLLAGTGSLGEARYYVLIEGDSDKNKDDRILDVKQQETPTAIAFLGAAEREAYEREYPNTAKRQALAYLALTTTRDDSGATVLVDDHLGWMRLFDADFSVRERSPHKDTFPTDPADKKAFEKIFASGAMTDADLSAMAGQWGTVLATAHARSIAGSDAFEREVKRLVDADAARFAQQVADIAGSYADRVEADWGAFKEALAPKNTDGCPA